MTSISEAGQVCPLHLMLVICKCQGASHRHFSDSKVCPFSLSSQEAWSRGTMNKNCRWISGNCTMCCPGP